MPTSPIHSPLRLTVLDAEPPIRKMLSCVDLWPGGPQVVPPILRLVQGMDLSLAGG